MLESSLSLKALTRQDSKAKDAEEGSGNASSRKHGPSLFPQEPAESVPKDAEEERKHLQSKHVLTLVCAGCCCFGAGCDGD